MKMLMRAGVEAIVEARMKSLSLLMLHVGGACKMVQGSFVQP
jgi:hypothetical protein